MEMTILESKDCADFLDFFGLNLSAYSLRAIRGDAEKIVYGSTNTIVYSAPSHFYRLLAYFCAHPHEKGTHLFPPKISELTFMLDCSRNAVMKVASLHELVLYLAYGGYDSLMLYTEDTFTIPGEPFFGYMRGAYSAEELQDIDAFAFRYGIELIPCIETLAHLNSLTHWYPYEKVFDLNDILLVDSEDTYALIEKMVAACARSFHSRRINIGMDEAHLLGRGRHQDLHGPEERFPLMMRHLKRVLAILDKYGFKAMMWADMFSSFLQGKPSPESLSLIPKNVTLIYWDYYSSEPEHYLQEISNYQKAGNPLSLATGAWKWSGFAPLNFISLKSMKAAFAAAEEKKLPQVIVTAWGDNGGETSPFAVLPSILWAALLRNGGTMMDRPLFEKMTGYPFDDFLELDDANKLFPDHLDANSMNRYLLWMDPLLSPFDSLVPSSAQKTYQDYAKKLVRLGRKKNKLAYLFQTQALLNDVLSTKAPLGLELRQAYQSGDKKALQIALQKTKSLQKRLEKLILVFEAQWMKENKPEGYEVQSLRFGGLRERLRYVVRVLEGYLSGKQEAIPELAIRLLDYYGDPEKYTKADNNCEYRYGMIASVGVNI
jgi:hypothetical protein